MHVSCIYKQAHPRDWRAFVLKMEGICKRVCTLLVEVQIWQVSQPVSHQKRVSPEQTKEVELCYKWDNFAEESKRFACQKIWSQLVLIDNVVALSLFGRWGNAITQAGRQAGYSWTGGGLRPTNRAAGWLKIVSNGNRRRSGGFRCDDDNSSDCALLFALNGVCSSRASKLRILVFSRILTG